MRKFLFLLVLLAACKMPVDGVNGVAGKDGADGAPGKDGEDGTTTTVTVVQAPNVHVVNSDGQGEYVISGRLYP